MGEVCLILNDLFTCLQQAGILYDFIMFVTKFLNKMLKNPTSNIKTIYRIPIGLNYGGSVQLSFKQNSVYCF
jgi:hypothetical protein